MNLFGVAICPSSTVCRLGSKFAVIAWSFDITKIDHIYAQAENESVVYEGRLRWHLMVDEEWDLLSLVCASPCYYKTKISD
jgi:hypothetical protein